MIQVIFYKLESNMLDEKQTRCNRKLLSELADKTSGSFQTKKRVQKKKWMSLTSTHLLLL